MQVISSGGIPLALALGGARDQAAAAVAALRRLGRRRLAGLDRVRDRAALRLPGRAAGRDRGRRLVAPRPAAGRAAAAGRRRGRGACSSPWSSASSRSPTSAVADRLPGGDAARPRTSRSSRARSRRCGSTPTRTSSGATRPSTPSARSTTPPRRRSSPALVILLLAAVGLGSSSFPRWLRFSLGRRVGRRSWSSPSASRRRTAGSGPTGSSTTCCRAGRRSGRRAGSRRSRRWRWRCSRRPGRSRCCGGAARRGASAPAATSARRAWSPVRSLPLLVLAVIVEGRGLPFDPTHLRAQPEVPDPPPSLADVPGPQLHLPAERGEDNRRYTLWSTDGFPDIVNGRASTRPDSIEDLIADMETLPRRGDGPAPARLRGPDRGPPHGPGHLHRPGARRRGCR